MNSFYVIGFAAGKPQLTEVSGTLVANVRIGEPRTRREGGQSIEYMENFDGALWGERAKRMVELVESGDELLLDGELSVRRFRHNDVDRQALEIRIEKWRLLTKKSDREAARSARAAARAASEAAANSANGRPPAAAEPEAQPEAQPAAAEPPRDPPY